MHKTTEIRKVNVCHKPVIQRDYLKRYTHISVFDYTEGSYHEHLVISDQIYDAFDVLAMINSPQCKYTINRTSFKPIKLKYSQYEFITNIVNGKVITSSTYRPAKQPDNYYFGPDEFAKALYESIQEYFTINA